MLKQIKSFLGIEKKSLGASSPFMSFVNYLAFNGWANLSAFQSMQYYLQVSPLYDAINKISKECSSIKIFIQDCNTEKFIKQHQVLDLLKNPNSDMGRKEFFEQIVSYFLITGNTYFIATGDVSKPPLEIYTASPEFITLIPNAHDGYTQSIFYTSNQRSIHFERKVVKGRHRFYDEEGKREIWHTRMFNPIKGYTNNYGLSPIAPIYYEIEQYIKAGLHNLSLLVRGGRPTGALTMAETLSDDAYARLQEQMERFNSGPENAGRMWLLDNGLKFEEMSTTNRDMDFEKLKERLITQIYNSFSIPLPLIAQGHMSYNNLETAKLSLYDFAVLPILSRILEELSNFLLYRYENGKTLEIVYNKDGIPALQLRRNEELTMTKNLGVNTINEIRAMMGFKAAIGGNDIYSSASAYPIARVTPEISEEETEELNAQDSDKVIMLDYITSMRHLKNAKGLPAFSDAEIKLLAGQYGLLK